MSKEYCRRLEYEATNTTDSETAVFWKERKSCFDSLIPQETRADLAGEVWSIVTGPAPRGHSSIRERQMIDEIFLAARRLGAESESEAVTLWLNRLRAERLGYEAMMIPSSRPLSPSQRAALDARQFHAVIAKHVQQTGAEPMYVSVIQNGIGIAQSQLDYWLSLLGVAEATSTQASEPQFPTIRADGFRQP
jgi:hypothetical protein